MKSEDIDKYYMEQFEKEYIIEDQKMDLKSLKSQPTSATLYWGSGEKKVGDIMIPLSFTKDGNTDAARDILASIEDLLIKQNLWTKGIKVKGIEKFKEINNGKVEFMIDSKGVVTVL